MTAWYSSLVLSIFEAPQVFLDLCIAMDAFDTFMIFGLVSCVFVVHHDDLSKVAIFVTSYFARLCRLFSKAVNQALSAIYRFAVWLSAIVEENIILPACHWSTAFVHAARVYLMVHLVKH